MKIFFICIMFIIVSCSSSNRLDSSGTRIPSSLSFKDRGNDYDYDPGPPANTNWASLFADTPNYRAFGKAVLGGKGEKFRWIFGPMWYRGRLAKNKVKILIVGQEGAQDENVSNRSFTGSTGTRMQKFLRYLGINREYLFMNTFVYTIKGQYTLFNKDRKNEKKVEQTKKVRWLAQNKNSIIVAHRHKMFNEVLRLNNDKLKIVVGVGIAGKDSIVTWIKSNGGLCSVSKLSKNYCQGSGKLKNIFFIGVRHPGAASARNAGSSAGGGLRQDFQRKADIIKKLIKTGEIKFPIDPGSKRDFSKPFKYGYASIPREDFSFGTNWQMGSWGTTSNRRNPTTIQVFSGSGCYNNKQYKSLQEFKELNIDSSFYKKAGKCLNRSEVTCLDRKLRLLNPSCPEIAKKLKGKIINLKYDTPLNLIDSPPIAMQKGDVPYESPKSKKGRFHFDIGPSKTYAKLLIDQFYINYKSQGVTASLDFGPQGLYRGRFKNIKILILADQLSYDDMFSGRALTGTQGQQLQSYLNAMGIIKSYLILRTIPVDTFDLNKATRNKIAQNKTLVNKRNKIINKVLKENKIQLILTVGTSITKGLKKLNIPFIHLPSEFSNSKLSNVELKTWRKQLLNIKKLKLKFDKLGTFKFNGKLSIIPRIDLPAGTRWWMGTSGSRVTRAYSIINKKKVFNGNYYKVYAPNWVRKWKSKVIDLSSSEKKSVKSIGQDWLDYSF